jgi:putative spermidine/putrescine transport system permease protein
VTPAGAPSTARPAHPPPRLPSGAAPTAPAARSALVAALAPGGAPRPALLCLPLAALLALLLVWPLLMLIRESLWDAELGAATLSRYARIASEPRLRGALFTSLWLSAVIAVLSTALCFPPAWLLARGRFRGQRLLRAILALPMAFSGVIVGFLMVITLGRAGFVPELSERLVGARWLAGSAYTFAGLCAAYLYFEIPRATLTLEAALRRVDFLLIDAARSLGAGRLQVLRLVVLPVLRPALVSTTALTFSVSLGSFGVILIMATRQMSVLPLEIFMAYLAFPSDRATAAAMSVTLVACALGASYAARRWLDLPVAPRARA